MATWDKISHLPLLYQSKIIHFYKQYNFPIEIRSRLANWFEQQNWPLIEATLNVCETNVYGERPVQLDQLVNAFIEQLGKLLEISNEVPLNYQLHNLLQEMASSTNLDVIRSIVECLKYEQSVLHKHAQCNSAGGLVGDDQLEAMASQTKEKLQQAENLSRTIKAYVEEINIKSSELNTLLHYQNQVVSGAMAMPTQEQQQELEAKKGALIQEMKNSIAPQYTQCRLEFLGLLNELIDDLENTFNNVVLINLNDWKLRQQFGELSGGIASCHNIMQLREMCEQFTMQIRTVLLRIQNVETLLAGRCFKDEQSVEALKVIKAKVIELLKMLVNETFVIKQQPRQVIKKDTKFVATLTLLISGVLNVPMNAPTVKVSIINEMQAKQLHLDRDCHEVDNCGEILNNTCVMEHNDATRSLVANFANLQLKRIKRNEKKGTESVCDEKFSLLFTTEFFIDPDLKIHAKALSVPVVVIVHGNQDASAQATITWDNAFSAPTRCPFEVPQEVRFELLARVLSQKFLETAGRPLSEENLHFLACKLQGNTNFDLIDPFNATISWSRFCKEHLPGQTFTFWDWFYAIFKLVRDHLTDLWRDGYILGFLTRQRAEELLQDKPPGTFLLRFSDTKLGGISVASVTCNREIYMVDPYMAKDLLIRKLADRLHDIEELTFLYPDRPKNDAFGLYYTKENQLRNGYVRPLLRNYIPFLSSNEFASTPSPSVAGANIGGGGNDLMHRPIATPSSTIENMPMSNEYYDFESSLVLDNSEENIFDFDQFSNC